MAPELFLCNIFVLVLKSKICYEIVTKKCKYIQVKCTMCIKKYTQAHLRKIHIKKKLVVELLRSRNTPTPSGSKTLFLHFFYISEIVENTIINKKYQVILSQRSCLSCISIFVSSFFVIPEEEVCQTIKSTFLCMNIIQI